MIYFVFRLDFRGGCGILVRMKGTLEIDTDKATSMVKRTLKKLEREHIGHTPAEKRFINKGCVYVCLIAVGIIIVAYYLDEYLGYWG